MNYFRKKLPWLLVILWMTMIFYLSHQPATKSNCLSKEITEKIVKVVEKIVMDVDFNSVNFNHLIRKNAHFFSYLLLGVLVMNGLRSSGVSGYRIIVFALGICILYAISDEVHQLFVPGRGGRVTDVIIDSAGAVVGIGIYFVEVMICQ